MLYDSVKKTADTQKERKPTYKKLFSSHKIQIIIMENFIIGLFTEQLSTYIHGFRKEQVNASLLSGKGEISEVHVNVEPINEVLKDFVPYIELASVYVSKVSFNVTSIRNIRKSPIEISVDEVHVVVTERMKFSGYHGQTWVEMAKGYVEQAKNYGSYGLIERIRDNITIDVNRVYVTFQPMGKFKTRKTGPWTPPAISLVLNHVRVATVDEYGEEGSPDDVWRHNNRQGRQENAIRYRNSDNSKSERTYRSKTNMIFKKLSFELSIGIGYRVKGMSAKQTFLNSDVIILTNVPLQCHLAIHRRLRDNALLAAQVDVSMTNIEVVVESETLPLLVHAINGVQYCFIKDRTFIDPLDDGELDESILLLNDALPSYKIESEEAESKASSDEAKTMEAEDIPDQFDLESDEEESGDITNESLDMPPQKGDDSKINTVPDDEQWPAFILPSGIIIVEKLCVSLSIQSMSVRAVYNSQSNGHLQCTMKGLVCEFIWPKSTELKRGYLQLSLSHINIHETYARRIHTLINGGNYIERDVYGDKVTTKDESFPSMEPRDVRNDPFDMETSFPTQAFSLKASIDVLDKVSSVSTFILLRLLQHTILIS